MIKKILKFLLFIVIIIVISIGIIFYGTYVSVEKVNLNYETITSSKISKDLDNLKIAFVSDIHYNHYMNQERLKPMIEKLNHANPDVVIFGGDIFDHPEINAPTPVIQSEITTILSSIKAPLGKFAVLGEQDLMNENVKAMCEQILYNSDFELLSNRSARIHKNSIDSFALVGIDSLLGGTPNVETAFTNVSDQDFVLCVSHAPDIISQLPMNNISLLLAGHSHGGQIKIPFIGPLNKIEGAKDYVSGTHHVKGAKVHISNGIGTTNSDIRIFAPAEILIYRLVSK
ncbi:MAG: metallophosphoesterase [Erysipelotrichaceae bacterium]